MLAASGYSTAGADAFGQSYNHHRMRKVLIRDIINITVIIVINNQQIMIMITIIIIMMILI